jgi:D-alanine--poly(phosphoribitol) ligase subunit 1
MDLLARIDRWGDIAPTRVAHVSETRTLTYGELRRRSNALAAHLARTLPSDRSPVAVLGHKEPEMLIGFLGAVKAAHPYVPLDTGLPASRIQRIAAVAGARITLTPATIAAFAETPAPAPACPLAPTDPYYVIFTSGSTGDPKGVVITLECLTSFLGWMLSEHAFGDGDETFLNQAPFSFDLSVMDLYLTLATGGTLYSLTSDQITNPKRLYQALAASTTTSWVSTPSFVRMCLVERTFAQAMLPRLRRFLFCGETLPPEVAGQLLARFPNSEVWNTYGPTEATVATTSIRVDHGVLARYSPLPVGRPKPDTRILLLDEDGREAPPGERGEIVIVGANVSPGYLGRHDLTAHAFRMLDGVRAYRTGDYGRFRDGLLFFEGRIDDQIKLHGYRVELGDVEAHLRALPDVQDAAVLPVPREGAPESLEAFVIPARPLDIPEAEAARRLRADLGDRLPVYMLPRRIVFRDAFPLTANGKVDRRRLADLLA